MSLYYITTLLDNKLIRISLDATTQIGENFTSTLSKFVFEDGSQGSENIVNNNNRITFGGVITDTKSLGSGFVTESEDVNVRNNPEFTSIINPEDESISYASAKKNKELLERTRREKLPVVITVPNRDEGELYVNCYITGMSFSQSVRNGSLEVTAEGGGNLVSSYKVNLSFTQVRTGARAEEIVVRDEDLIAQYWFNKRVEINKLKMSLERKKRADEKAKEKVCLGLWCVRTSRTQTSSVGA